MPQSLRIVITSDPGWPIPQRHRGSIERAVALLVDVPAAREHGVTRIFEEGLPCVD